MAIESIGVAITTSIANDTTKGAIGTIRQHVHYYTKYKKNVEMLENLMKDLEAKRNDLKNNVDAAQRNLQEPFEQVKRWLKKYDDEVKGKYEQLQEHIRMNSTRQSFLSTYKIGKRVVKMINDIREHNRNFDFNATTSSHNAPCERVEPIPTEYVSSFGSLERAKKEVMDALSCAEVSVILVHGMGGVGKTTLMQSINNELKDSLDLFNAVIMVTVSSNLDYKTLQDGIARRMDLHLDKNQEIYIRARRLSKRLQQEGSVLIILDDVWEGLDIGKLGIASCKIVMTTRNRDIHRNAERKIHVHPLTEEESWNLFREKVGEVIDRNEIKPTAKEICKECDGLPLAITVLASCLTGEQEVFMWKSHLHYLKNKESHNIEGLKESLINILKLSYDHLPTPKYKSCFLACGLFPEDYEIHVHELTRHGLGEGFVNGGQELTLVEDCLSLVETLKRRGLLLEVDKMRVRMHDVVRDVAIYIATIDVEHGFYVKEGLTEWPQQEELRGRKRLSFLNHHLQQLPDQPGCDAKIKTLMLMKGSEIKLIADGFFSDMPNLSTLELGDRYTSSLPSSLPGLKNLRVFSMRSDSNTIDIKKLLELRNLVVVSLKNFKIGELPKEIGELAHLKILDLSKSEITVIRPNVLSKLQQLEELHMAGSFDKWKAYDKTTEEADHTQASFSELATLVKLNVLYVQVSNAEVFTQDLNPKAFARLSIFNVNGIDSSKGNSLWIKGDPVRHLAGWVKNLMGKAASVFIGNFAELSLCDALSMEELASLDLEGGTNLKDMFRYMLTTEESIGSVEQTEQQKQKIEALWPRLMRLHLTSFPQLENIISCCNKQGEKISSSPLPPRSFQNLEEVTIFKCPRLHCVFSSSLVACLVRLRKLTLWNCDSLEEIIGERVLDEELPLHVFPNLKELMLFSLPKLEGLCRNYLHRPIDWSSQLDYLHLTRCPRLSGSFLSGQSEPKLKEFYVDGDWFESLAWEDEHVKNKWKDMVTEFY